MPCVLLLAVMLSLAFSGLGRALSPGPVRAVRLQLLRRASSSSWSSPLPAAARAALCPEEQVVYDYLVSECGVSESSSLLLCVSGGLDSMALLHLLVAVRTAVLPNLTLQVVNFNHKLRPEADEEAEFVCGWASRYGLASLQRVLPEELRPRPGSNKSVQSAAREWRRSEGLEIMRSWGGGDGRGSGIVTAHHSDDQVETVLLKLLRGAHLSRLHPILPRSECGNFIRPLLLLSKAQLGAYMEERGLDWRQDSSNEERKYTRNKVRLDVIPALQLVAGGDAPLKQRVLALGQQSAQLREWLRAEAAQFLQSDHVLWQKQQQQKQSDLPASFDTTGAFAHLAPMVQSEVLHEMCTRLTGTSTDYEQTQKIVRLCQQDLAAGGVAKKSLRLSEDWEATKIGSELRFEKIKTGGGEGGVVAVARGHCEIAPGILLDFPTPDVTIFPAGESSSSSSSNSNSRREYKLCLQAQSERSHFAIRYPKLGDVFRPSWRASPGKLSDFLRSMGVPLHRRDKTPLVLCDDVIVAVLLPDRTVLGAGAEGAAAARLVSFTVLLQ